MISAIQAVEAVKRKPDWVGNVTFYGENDLWQFIASNAPNMCPECESYDGNNYYGISLRSEFEYHIIVDENTIYAKVHPNCGCILTRVFIVRSEDYELD